MEDKLLYLPPHRLKNTRLILLNNLEQDN